MKIALYLRVSTGEQEIENQAIQLREFAPKQGWQIVEVDVQTDERFLKNIEGYLMELVCNVESIEEVNLIADVLVPVQDALRDLAQTPPRSSASSKGSRKNCRQGISGNVGRNDRRYSQAA